MREGTKILDTMLQKAPEFEKLDGINETAGYDECSAIVKTPGGLQYVVIVRELDEEEQADG